MKRQRNTIQMKKQIRNTEVQIDEEEIEKIPEKEFRIMIVKMIKKLWKQNGINEESTNKDREELKDKHTETDNTITEIKNTLVESIAEYLKEKNESVSWKIKWWK